MPKMDNRSKFYETICVIVSVYHCTLYTFHVCVYVQYAVLEIMASIQTISDHFGILSDPKRLGQTFC